ncbi:hypothetical protein XELAEV_18029743mg [Xenopus laevis]|uniref:Uncharacterized protein n=1 Tax=Xenopus laevis TaxID=8355 RepID=A0A974CSP8_XENLA|nr:hypothetical protein XELAEV_18029743mg [Xenopus laevis]
MPTYPFTLPIQCIHLNDALVLCISSSCECLEEFNCILDLDITCLHAGKSPILIINLTWDFIFANISNASHIKINKIKQQRLTFSPLCSFSNSTLRHSI